MKSLWSCLVNSAMVIAVSTCSTSSLVAEENNDAGIVRITKPKTESLRRGTVTQVNSIQLVNGCNPPAATSMPAVSCDPAFGGADFCPSGMCQGACECGPHGWGRQNWRHANWQASNAPGAGLRARTQAQSLAMEHAMGGPFGHRPCTPGHDQSGHAMLDYFKCKFGYFIPSGGGGKGVPWVGHYARVYPQNPYYGDARDGQTYAAQGYGVPMAVPLAPVVGHTYEYGWGVPSSRLTPVSHPAY